MQLCQNQETDISDICLSTETSQQQYGWHDNYAEEFRFLNFYIWSKETSIIIDDVPPQYALFELKADSYLHFICYRIQAII